MKTAVIYARYSCEKQTEQSIEGQLHVCKEYAERNGILILDTYIDRATSGTTDNRKAFQQMIKDSSKKAWGFVLVYKLDRFSRNKYESAIHKRTLRDNGIKLISATENIPETPEGIILESLLEGMAEYYSAELSQKVKRGLNESRQKGTFQGGQIPFGYKVVDKKLVINEEEASIVRFIYEQYASNVFVKDIKQTLDNRGVTNKGKPLEKNTIYNILKSEKYVGRYTFNGQSFPNMYPRIVSDDIYNIVRRKTEENHYGKHDSTAVYLLKNLIKCGYCGKPIASESGTSENGEIKRYYKCSGRKQEKACKKAILRKELLEELIVSTTINAFTKETDIDALAEKLLKTLNNQLTDNSVLTLLLDEKKQLEKSLNNILDAVEKGIVTSSTKRRLENIESKLEDVDTKILLEESRSKTLLTKKEVINYIETALKKEPQTMLKLLIKEIILFDDHVEIYYKFNNKKTPDDTKTHQAFSFYNFNYTCKIQRYRFKYAEIPVNLHVICYI